MGSGSCGAGVTWSWDPGELAGWGGMVGDLVEADRLAGPEREVGTFQGMDHPQAVVTICWWLVAGQHTVDEFAVLDLQRFLEE
jgi:hypothetical protein